MITNSDEKETRAGTSSMIYVFLVDYKAPRYRDIEIDIDIVQDLCVLVAPWICTVLIRQNVDAITPSTNSLTDGVNFNLSMSKPKINFS